jgi:1,4-alpha-glucan branching enzyme
MPGDDWQKFANLRLLFGYMFGQPGKKLHFMGGEIGQWDEWDHEKSVDWHLLAWDPHKGVQQWVQDLNAMYKSEPALYEDDFSYHGFEWIDCGDWQSSVLMFLRKCKDRSQDILVVCNFTPVVREYRVGVPYGGMWRELLNSDAPAYWGSGVGNYGRVMADEIWAHGRDRSLWLKLPPLGVLFLKRES